MHERIWMAMYALLLLGSALTAVVYVQQGARVNALQQELDSERALISTLKADGVFLRGKLDDVTASYGKCVEAAQFAPLEYPASIQHSADGQVPSFTWESALDCSQRDNGLACLFPGRNLYQTLISNASNSDWPWLDSRDAVFVQPIDQSKPLPRSIEGKFIIYKNATKTGTIIHKCILLEGDECIEYGPNNAVSMGRVPKDRIVGSVEWSCRRYA